MLRYIFSQQYLFSPSFNGLKSISDLVFSGIMLALLAAGCFVWAAVARTKNPHKKELLINWRRLCFTVGIAALLWVFLRYEGIAAVSARWIILALYLIGLIWAAYILKYYKTKYLANNAEYEKEQQKKKYI